MNQLDCTIQDWRVGVPMGKFFNQMQPVVAAAFKNTVNLLTDLGCRLIDFDPPGIEEMDELCTIIIQAEGSFYHERYRTREHLYGHNFCEHIFPGREMKAQCYLAACHRKQELQRKWRKLASRFDLLVTPSGPAVAPPHGTITMEIENKSFPIRPLLNRFTRPFNLLGWPALSVPNGISAEGLPTGVQVAGPPDSEGRLLILGYRLEEALGLVNKLGIQPRYQP